MSKIFNSQNESSEDFEFEKIQGINVVKPYKHKNAWVWDDASGNRHNFAPAGSVGKGLSPIVVGADRLVTEAASQKSIKSPEDGFLLYFSEEVFPDADVCLEWIEEKYGGDIYNVIPFPDEENCAFKLLSGQQSWICQDLRLHYKIPPEKLWIKVAPAIEQCPGNALNQR